MPPNPKRYWRLAKSRRFLLSIGPLVLSLMFAFAFVVVGVFDGALGLTGERHDPQAEYGEVGAPPLTAGDRVAALASRLPLDTAGIAGAPLPIVDLLPGVRGVNYAAQCSNQPAAQMERAGTIRHITVHTSEEDAGSAGADAVCRYGNQLYDRTFYNWYIFQTGQIYQTLPEGVKPYAQLTRNAGDVAVVLQGRSNVDVPSEAQLSALYRLIPALATRYHLTAADLYGHRDWSRLDATDPTINDALKNNHTDPGTSWDRDHWGLGAKITATNQPSSVPRPDLTRGAQMSGTASYYNPTGNPTANGEKYDGKALTGATWLVDGKPAYPFGSWLRVCLADGSKCAVYRVNDTGAFVPPRVADLSPRAFDLLAPRSKGVVNVTLTYLGTEGIGSDGQPQHFYPCWASPELGGWVYGDMWRVYSTGRPNGNTQYGCPTDAEPTSPDGGTTWIQTFTKGTFVWTAAGGTRWQPAR